MRVLLVEDDDGIRSALGRVMRAHGHEVTEANSVHSAHAFLDASDFDVVVLDINLPDAPGWSVFDHPRLEQNAEARPRTIVMSAVLPNAERLRETGPRGVLLKPFPVNSLLRLVASDATVGEGWEVS